MTGRPEDERVKIPALVRSTRLNYKYVSLKKANAYDGDKIVYLAMCNQCREWRNLLFRDFSV